MAPLTGTLTSGRKLAMALLATTAAFLSAATSCGGPAEKSVAPSDTSGSTPSGPLIPLAIGTRWTYDSIDSVLFTTDTSRDHSFHQRQSFAVIADTIVADGSTWAVLDSASGIIDVSGGPGAHGYVANRSGGFWSLNLTLAPILSLLFFEFPYPAKVGTSENFGITIVLKTDTVVTVPAGTFHCLLYAESGDSVFVAPGVGVVARLTNKTGTEFVSGQVVERSRFYYVLKSLTGP